MFRTSRHRGELEAEIKVSIGVSMYFSRGRGFNYSVCKQVNFGGLGSTWLVIILPYKKMLPSPPTHTHFFFLNLLIGCPRPSYSSEAPSTAWSVLFGTGEIRRCIKTWRVASGLGSLASRTCYVWFSALRTWIVRYSCFTFPQGRV